MLCGYGVGCEQSCFSKRAVAHWHGLHREVVRSLCLGVLQNHRDVALRDTITGGDGLGLDSGI